MYWWDDYLSPFSFLALPENPMADRRDSDATSNSGPSPEWLADEWSTLCDVLGTSDPSEVVPRVRTLKQKMDQIDEESDRPSESFVTISEVEEVFREMHDRLQKLRERNAALVEKLEGQSEDGVESAFKELHRENEELLEELGVTSIDEAKSRVRSMNRQLENLYHEKETLVEAGYTSAEEALAEMQNLRSERDRLKSQSDSYQDAKPDTSVLQAASAIRTIVGVSSIGEAQELARAVRTMSERLQEMAAARERITEVTGIENAEDVAAMINNMEEQLAELYEEREHDDRLPSEISDVLGVSTVEEAQELERLVRSMGERAQEYQQERSWIAEETGVDTAQGVLDMIRSMEEQLIDLYERAESGLPEEIGEILGIEDVDDARQLERLVRSMGTRLQEFRRTHEELAEQTGVSDAEGVIDMINSMEEQLVDLYQYADEKQQEAAQAKEQAREAAQEAQDADQEATQEADQASDPEQTDVMPAEVGRVLGVETVDDARELENLVQNMTSQLEELTTRQEKLEDAGLTVDQAIAMIDTMEEQLVDLYEDRRAGRPGENVFEVDESGNLTGYAGGDSSPAGTKQNGTKESNDTATATVDEQTRETYERVVDVLGVETPTEAEELGNLVRSMSDRLEDLTADQEKLVDAGLTVDTALQMINSMEEQLVDLYEARESDLEVADEYDTVRDVLGVETPDEARELARHVREIFEQMQEMRTDRDAMLEETGMDSPRDVLDMIQSMEEQLIDLYEERDTGRAAASEYNTVMEVLGVDTVDEARELATLVRDIFQQMQQMQADREAMLEETGMESPRDVLAMIRSMEEQLVDLYEARESQGNAEAVLDEIEAELGIRTAEGARDLAEMAGEMNRQLRQFDSARERLSDLGLNSVADAAAMIESMESQLMELYQDKEAVVERSALIDEDQDTFQQLEALYAEREKLERELGVASADEVIEMVEGLATQLDELYSDRDDTIDGFSDELGELVDGGENDSAQASRQATSGQATSGQDLELVLESMEQQLQDLYAEKEHLLDLGLGNAEEAAERIESLQAERETLAKRAADCKQRFDRLHAKLGTSTVEDVVQLVDRLQSESGTTGDGSPSDGSPSDGGPSGPDAGNPKPASLEEPPSSSTTSSSHPGLHIDAAPQFAPDDTLARLEDMGADDLDALGFGAIRLSERGEVEFINEAGLDLPGLKEVDDKTTITGKNFFFDLAPSTNNNLFFGRFKQGLKQGAMDARFPYTFISPGRGPTVLIVHLHSKPESPVNWLLFKSM